MTKAMFKKAYRTRFEGQCECGGGARWVEVVATRKRANRGVRREGKKICQAWA